MALQTEAYDVADYLDSDEMRVAYLNEVLQLEEPKVLAKALQDIARAGAGLHQVANDLGMPETELLSALNDENLSFQLTVRIIHALKLGLTASSAHQEAVPAAA